MADADAIIRRQEELAAARGIWESHWREIAERVLPRQDFFQKKPAEGQKNTERIFDATACLALERFSAAVESMTTPRTQRWHRLKASEEALNENHEVRVYLDAVTDMLFSVRYQPSANFASQVYETFISLGAFGSGGLFIDDVLGKGLRYKSLHLSELYFCENYAGIIDTVYRCFQLSARQALQRFKTLPEKIRNTAEKHPDQLFDFIHAVYPRDEGDNRRGSAHMAFASCYVAIDGRMVVEESGYRTFPYAISRYVTAPRETYGRSPAMLVLPDIKMLNEMSKTVLRAGQKIVDPPLLLPEDGVLQAFDLRSGALNYGGVDDNGRQMVHPLQTNGRVDIGLDMMEQRRKTINDAFLVTLFQILVDTPQMTATEAMLRAQEKGALIAPTMGRIQSEMLGPMVTRELDILGHAGVLPPMPDALVEAGGMVEVEYVSPLNRMQRSEDGVAILNTLQAVTPLAQIDPSVMDVFDAQETARELAEIYGVPEKVLRSPEAVAAMKQARAEQAQAQALLQAAPVASGVVNDMAQAHKAATAAPF